MLSPVGIYTVNPIERLLHTGCYSLEHTHLELAEVLKAINQTEVSVPIHQRYITAPTKHTCICKSVTEIIVLYE